MAVLSSLVIQIINPLKPGWCLCSFILLKVPASAGNLQHDDWLIVIHEKVLEAHHEEQNRTSVQGGRMGNMGILG